MGRELDRAIFKGLYRKNKVSNSVFGSNVDALKSKLVDKDTLITFMFSDGDRVYNLAPLFCLLKSMVDTHTNITYLDDFFVSEYADYIDGVTTELIDMRNTADIICNMDGDTATGRLVGVLLPSLYVLYNDFDEVFKDYIDTVNGAIYLAHKNVLGLCLMLKDDARLLEQNSNRIVMDILSCYVNTCNMCKTANSLGRVAGDITEVFDFIRLCFKFFIELNSEGGPTFDLLDVLGDKSPKYLEWLNYLSLQNLRTLPSDYLSDVQDNIHTVTFGLLSNILNSINVAVEIGVDVSNSNKDAMLKDIKNKHLKEVKALEKENKLLSKQLKESDNSLKKLQKYIDKRKAINGVDDYKRKIEELELKNKQLESKLEGANLRIETLEDRVATLKDEVSKSEVAITKDSVDVVTPVVDEVIDLDTMINKLRDLNIVIVGGTDTSYKRISNYLPDVRYIDAETSPNFDIPLNSDYIVLCTKILSHSHTRRAEVFENSVKGIVKVSKTNPIEVIKEIYNTVVC